jgi:outer membrane protein OmpA-like peptidoglycan-associated protein
MKRKTEFNFWPSFTDFLLGLVFILFLLFIAFVILSEGLVNLSLIYQSQRDFIESTVKLTNGTLTQIDSITVGVKLSPDSEFYDIIFVNEPTLQRIKFSTNILFKKNEYYLTERGRFFLKIAGSLIKSNLKNIREIQIQGHADIDPTLTYRSNVELAALRAIEVFNFLKDSIGISPVENLMSIASFGEYKPVSRNEFDYNFTEEDLFKANSTPELKALNRRIEILIFYKL